MNREKEEEEEKEREGEDDEEGKTNSFDLFLFSCHGYFMANTFHFIVLHFQISVFRIFWMCLVRRCVPIAWEPNTLQSIYHFHVINTDFNGFLIWLERIQLKRSKEFKRVCTLFCISSKIDCIFVLLHFTTHIQFHLNRFGHWRLLCKWRYLLSLSLSGFVIFRWFGCLFYLFRCNWTAKLEHLI